MQGRGYRVQDGVALRLVNVARSAATVLQGQAGARRRAGERAAEEFAGAYAQLFSTACNAEASDRARLAGVLYSVMEQVEDARIRAQEERERVAALAAWEDREAQRRLVLSRGGPAAWDWGINLLDPKPYAAPVPSPSVSGAYMVPERDRAAQGELSKKSSADPGELRAFAADAEAGNNALEVSFMQVKHAWAGFTSACSWARVGQTTFVTGFDRLLEENRADATWVRHIAAAFEEAGGGTLTNFDLLIAVAGDQTKTAQGLLLSGTLTPEQVTAVWAALSGIKKFDPNAFITKNMFVLADLDGLPFAVMDQAARESLTFALDPAHPNRLLEAYLAMGFTMNLDDRSLADFQLDLEAIRDSLTLADASKINPSDVVQLVSFGRHDGAVTAGISLGDLDHAATVGVFIPGMMSDVRALDDTHDAFVMIRDEDTSIAMVHWVGYRSPDVGGEMWQGRADAGGARLATFLDGIAAQRADNPITRFLGIGHSYGTNVLAEALKATNAHLNAFVAIGSAGLKYPTTAADLKVDEIYATHAEGDPIAAGVGQHVHFRSMTDGGGLYEPRVDPRDLGDVYIFSSEKTTDGEAVTMHNLLHPIDFGPIQGLVDAIDGIPASEQVGYLHPDSSTVDGLSGIVRGEWEK